jgi:hypothetical protein
MPFLQVNAGRRFISGYHRQIHPQTTTLLAKSDNKRQAPGSSEATNLLNGKSAQTHFFGYMEFVG